MKNLDKIDRIIVKRLATSTAKQSSVDVNQAATEASKIMEGRDRHIFIKWEQQLFQTKTTNLKVTTCLQLSDLILPR